MKQFATPSVRKTAIAVRTRLLITCSSGYEGRAGAKATVKVPELSPLDVTTGVGRELFGVSVVGYDSALWLM